MTGALEELDLRTSWLAWCVALCLTAVAAPMLATPAPRPAGAVAAAAVDASSDAAGGLNVSEVLVWTHVPAGSPSLATVACGVHQTGVVLAAAYAGSSMTSAITNQQSNQYVGLFYLVAPHPGPQTVAVRLTAAGGLAGIQCSATTWTGATGVDLAIASVSSDLSGFATHVTLAPGSPPPSGEIFFAAIHRYMPQGAPILALGSTGASASLVDSNTLMGNGTGYGCRSVFFALWEDCIGTARLAAHGTSMTFTWTNSGYAVTAGIGLVEPAVPGAGGGVPTIVGLLILLLVALPVGIAVGVAMAAIIPRLPRLVRRPPRP